MSVDRLPTEHELPPTERINLEVQRANTLLDRLVPAVPKQATPAQGTPRVMALGEQHDAAAAQDAAPAGHAAPAKIVAPAKHAAPAGHMAPAEVADSAGHAVPAEVADLAGHAAAVVVADSAGHAVPAEVGAGGAGDLGAAELPGRGEGVGGQPGPARADAEPVAADLAEFYEHLQLTNAAILGWLARAGREFGLAYQLGRSIRDTANPPLRSLDRAGQGPIVPDPDHQKYNAVWYQLSRGRVAKLQEWLAALTWYLPGDSATIVSASLGHWGDLVSTIFDPAAPGRLRGAPRRIGDATKKVPRGHAGPPQPPAPSAGGGTRNFPSELQVAGELYKSLLPQGDAWLNLLTGAESSSGLLTPEGYVAAGEAALGRSARIIKRIVVHYWFVLLLVAGAVAAALFFAARDLGGAGKLWTQIATVGGALGITTKGIGNRMTTLTKDAGASLYSAAESDAKAWAITSIPDNLKLTSQGVRALRRSGIRGSVPLGRV